MMNTTKTLFLLICIGLLAVYFPAHSSLRIFSKKITMDEGLSSNRIYSVIQDPSGFIWFGTDNGLNRFDGLRFKKYHFTGREGDISSNNIRQLVIDKNDRMWIALDNGVDIYDPYTDSFSRLQAVTPEGEMISTRVLVLSVDTEGEIWIGTHGMGLYRYNPETNALIVYRNEPDDPMGISQNIILDVCCDSRGNIWIATYSEGVCCFNKEKEQFITYKSADHTGTISDNSIQKIFEDSYGNIWIGTFQNGLDLFEPVTNSFINYRDVSSEDLLYHIKDIKEYAPGELLIASDNGLGIFNITEGKIIGKEEARSKIGLPDTRFIYSVLCDNEGSIWMGSYFDGVEFFSQYQNNFEYYSCSPDNSRSTDKVINAICEDPSGKFWIGTDNDGIYTYDPKTGNVIPFKTAKDVHSTYYCIHDFLLDDNKLYVATYERGLEVYDLINGQMKTYLHDPEDTESISSSRVFILYKGSNGRIYIGTSNGLCYYNPETDDFTKVAPHERIASIVEDGKGNIWIATVQNGLFRYDLKKRELTPYQYDENNKQTISRNTINTLAVDRNKRLWVGTNGYGICEYDDKTDSFIRHEHSDFPNQSISAIIPDGDFLWISTNKGLVQFNPDTHEMFTYSKSNGLYNEQFTRTAGIKTSDGRIMLGSANGFCAFYPQKLLKNRYNAPLVLTAMSVFGNEVHPLNPTFPMDQSIQYTDKITLNYKQSVISFDFASLSYIAPKENTYRFIMEGFDKHWKQMKGSQQEVSYTNLTPGNYILRVKGTNNDKMWTQEEIKLEIKIQPPFYKSTIAYWLYMILCALCIGFITYWLRRRHQQIQSKQIEKIKYEKEKELYDSKINFFTHIAHEIRTPLSLITGPLEYIKESAVIEKEYSQYLDIIEQNYKRLSTLINQLLDFRKVDAGIYRLNYTITPLNKILDNILSLFWATAQKKNINLTISGTEKDIRFVTDEEAFTKIVCNLISNALKHAKHKISVSVRTDEKGLWLEITDDGSGVPEEEKEKIFDAFYQSGTNQEIAKLGLGIGLHMARSLVGLMEGYMYVQDKTTQPEGFSIVLFLPERKETYEPAETKESLSTMFLLEEKQIEHLEDNFAGQYIKKNHTILIVDDNPDILNFLSLILESDYFVISAMSGEEALKILENNTVDLIISDIMMDGMSGFELCREIKTNIHLSHNPVILLTAKTDLDSKITGLETGADAYIEKPFSPSHLCAQIRNLLAKKEKWQQQFSSTPLVEMESITNSRIDQEFLKQCTEIINKNISESDFSVNMLARELGMSRTSVFVKLKGITGMTPNDFIKLTRLNTACKLMVQGDLRITEIVFMVGFSSSSYFAKCFQKQFGILPTDFMKKNKTTTG